MTYTGMKQSRTILLALSRYAQVGPRLLDTLLHKYGQLDTILSANASSLLEIEGLAADQADRIAHVHEHLKTAADYLEELDSRDIGAVGRFDPEYPAGLHDLNDPPSVLYWRGQLPTANNKIATVCGSAQSSNEGIELTTAIVKDLVKSNVQLVSTLRQGIDIAVHLGARAAEGMSFAVTEVGFDDRSLDENMPVAIDIVRGGGLVCEYAPDYDSSPEDYHAANRLVAAMGQAVIITEVYQGSTRTLDLIECCAEIGKLLFLMIDPEFGALADESSLQKALDCGAIPMTGRDKVTDIIHALV